MFVWQRSNDRLRQSEVRSHTWLKYTPVQVSEEVVSVWYHNHSVKRESCHVGTQGRTVTNENRYADNRPIRFPFRHGPTFRLERVQPTGGWC